jgi:hypothetical protein
VIPQDPSFRTLHKLSEAGGDRARAARRRPAPAATGHESAAPAGAAGLSVSVPPLPRCVAGALPAAGHRGLCWGVQPCTAAGGGW